MLLWLRGSRKKKTKDFGMGNFTHPFQDRRAFPLSIYLKILQIYPQVHSHPRPLSSQQ
jgi:hypothetical protein